MATSELDPMYRKGRGNDGGTNRLALGPPASRHRPKGGVAVGGSRRLLPTIGLFAGIGGIELGLSRAGHPTLLMCETDPAASAVLKERFPGVPLRSDVRQLASLPRDALLLSAGFPCQDLSQAGRTAGLSGARSGLIEHVFRLLTQRRVPWVLLENVPFMLHLGGGRAIASIVGKLEQLGYRWAYRVVDTRAFGLPQRRERVFLLASLEDDPRDVVLADDQGAPLTDGEMNGSACGFYWTEGNRGLGWAIDAIPPMKGGFSLGIPSPPAVWLPSGAIVTPDIRDAERLQGFRVNWTRPAEKIRKRADRWRLIGNAVSVPVAEWLGERLTRPGDFDAGVAKPLFAGDPWPQAAWNVGYGRFAARVSAWPKRVKRRKLADFLIYAPIPLSARATVGFYHRALKSSLRFPPGFLRAVKDHLASMQRIE